MTVVLTERKRRRIALKGTTSGLPAPLIVGAAIVTFFVGIAFLSLVWTPHDPLAINVSQRLAPPGTPGHLLGTDRLGRDVASQLMAGARNSLIVSFAAAIGAILLGTVVGLMAAGAGQRWQPIVNRTIDLGVALPGLLIALVLATVFGSGRLVIIVAILLGGVPGVARVVMGPARQALTREYVEAAIAYGRTRRYILFRHVVPAISSILIVQFSLLLAAGVLAEVGLSYLGLGPQPPTSSWGRLLEESQAVVGQSSTLVLFPGLVITLVVLGFKQLGNGLHLLVDPHTARPQKRRTIPASLG